MGQVDPDLYAKPYFHRERSDGLYIERATNDLVLIINGTVVWRVAAASGLVSETMDPSEARGDIMRRNASAWGRLSAKTSGQVLCGNGTDVISAPITGDVSASHSGGNLAMSVTDLSLTSEAQGDLARRGASSWERLAAKTAGQVVIGNGTDVISAPITGDISASHSAGNLLTAISLTSQARGDLIRRDASAWGVVNCKTAGRMVMGDGNDVVSQALSGDVLSVSAAGSLVLASNVIQHVEGEIATADILSTSADKFGHAQGYPMVAGAGAHTVIELISCVLIYDFGVAAFSDGGDITVRYSGGGLTLSGAVTAANSVGAAADKVVILLPATPTNNALTEAAGLNLVAASAFTDAGGTATGVIRYKTTYRVHTTGL